MMAWLRTVVDLVCLWLGLWVIGWVVGDTPPTIGSLALSVGFYALLQHNKEHNA